MLTHRNLLMASFAALLALGLAACGTGGNGAAPVDMMDDPVPDPVPTAGEMAAATALADYDTAKAAYDAAIAAHEAAPTVQTAYVAKDLAEKAQAAADAAVAGAVDGNDDQKAAAATAVTDAAAAVEAAEAAVMMAGDAADAADAAAAAAAAAEKVAMDALATYATAKQTYDTAIAAYTATPSQETAAAAKTAADAAKDAADAAQAAAGRGGTVAQAQMAAAAVTEADAAVVAADAAVAEAQRVADVAAAAMEAERLAGVALAAYDDAKTAYETAKMAYDDDPTVMTAELLRDAAVEAQMKANVASAAAATGTAEQMAMAAIAVTDADAAVASAVQILVAAEIDAQIDAGIAAADAIGKYNIAKVAYDGAADAYGKVDANVEGATALVADATAAHTTALAAKTYADGGGTDEQISTARDAVTAAVKALADARYELMQAMTAEAAEPWETAIKTPSTAMAMLDATAERTADDVMVTAVGGDPVMDLAEGAAISIDNEWYRAVVADADDAMKTATVFTNIENTTDKFTNVHIADDNAAIDTVADTGVLNLDETGLMAWNTYVSADAFPGPNPDVSSQTVTYDGTRDFPRKFPGTFDGVSGTYECTATGNDVCSVTADAKGAITGFGAGGDWTFTPDFLGPDGESMAGDSDDEVASRADDLTEPSVAIPDVDYLRFGWWTEVAEDGALTLQTFFGGGVDNEFTVNNISELEGTATYKGPAAGRYAVKTFNSNATVNSIRHGGFTAAATLTANFGGDAIAVNDQLSISGAINGFEGENDDDLSAWSVALMRASLAAAALDAGVFSGMVGGALGGSPVNTADGGWTGEFFGNPVDENGDPLTGAALMTDAAHPLSVAGDFNAQSSHGAVVGAFGAKKE